MLTNLFLTVPSGAPSLVVQSFYSPSAIEITWDLLPPSVSHGTVLGYKIHVNQTRTDDTDPTEDLLRKRVLVGNASQTSFIFRNLSLFSKYQFQIAAYTSKGDGNFSDPVFGGKWHNYIAKRRRTPLSLHKARANGMRLDES